ncbi:MAG: AI-2E family transporter [Veillonellales bacterium]
MGATKRSVRLGVIIFTLAALFCFLWFVRSGLYPFVIATFLAYLLNPAVCYLEEQGVKRGWSILIIYFILFSSLILAGIKLIPILLRELEEFGQDIPEMAARGQAMIQAFQIQYQNSALPYSLRLALDDLLLTVENNIQEFIAAIINEFIEFFGHLIGVMISPVLAFYLLKEWFEIKKNLLQLLPAAWRLEAVLIGQDIDKVLCGIIRGQVIVAVIVGLLVSIGLCLLQLNFALLIALLAGILDFIPYFGAIIGAAPAVTLALLDSPWLALKVALLFILIHQLEGTVIHPKIVGESVGMHPLSVIFFAFIGGEVGGMLGMLLGVPVAAIVKVVIFHVYRLLV